MCLRKQLMHVLNEHLIGPLCDIVLDYARKHLVEYAVWEHLIHYAKRDTRTRTSMGWSRPQYRLRDFVLSKQNENGNYQLLTMHREHNILHTITELDIADVMAYLTETLAWFPKLDIW